MAASNVVLSPRGNQNLERLEIALNKIGLGTLIEKFKDEKVDFDTIVAASDNELTRLGVVTIGDKVRLREICKKESRNNNESNINNSSYSSVIRERSSLFSGYGSTSRRRGNQRRVGSIPFFGGSLSSTTSTKKKRPWTASFMCLASKHSNRVPTSTEKIILQNAGLGFKKIKLDLDDGEEEVYNKITSPEKVSFNDISAVGFPPLKECGGFEMLMCLPNSRDLRVINCSLAAKELKGKVGGGQGKLYIRPIQKSLSTASIVKEQNQSSLKEKCISCGEEMLLGELRKHIRICNPDSCDIDPFELSEEDDFILAEIPFTNSSDSLATSQGQSSGAADTNEGPLPVLQATNDLSPNSQQSSISQVENNSESVENAIEEIIPMDFNTKLKLVIEKIKQQKLDQNPVEMLKCLQTELITGRKLEITDIAAENDGATNFILVDRTNILETGFDELEEVDDYFVTLEVQFYNEVYMCIHKKRKFSDAELVRYIVFFV